MALFDDMKTEPGFMLTVSLSFEQRANLDKIKDDRVAAGKPRPTVRELVNEALETFIRLELQRRF